MAGALMRQDTEGFLALEAAADAYDGACKVMAFAKVRLKHVCAFACGGGF